MLRWSVKPLSLTIGGSIPLAPTGPEQDLKLFTQQGLNPWGIQMLVDYINENNICFLCMRM
jgi:hypothetical protein